MPILAEEITPEGCTVKKKTSKILLSLKKADATKGWFELRKTKGVGDTEYHKLVPGTTSLHTARPDQPTPRARARLSVRLRAPSFAFRAASLRWALLAAHR